MEKNQYTPLDNLPDESDLKKMISPFKYKRINTNELPKPIDKNGLVKKCNSFILAASGNTEGMLYSFVGIRPDKDDVVDEHPFVLYYDYNDSKNNFGGIIHHGDWNGRTIPLDNTQISAMSASGLTASFNYKSIPTAGSGSLDELRQNGMLEGLSHQFEILFKKGKQTNNKQLKNKKKEWKLNFIQEITL